jgi:hypothetical protein
VDVFATGGTGYIGRALILGKVPAGCIPVTGLHQRGPSGARHAGYIDVRMRGEEREGALRLGLVAQDEIVGALWCAVREPATSVAIMIAPTECATRA